MWPSQLQEEHKKHLIQFFYEYPQATRRDTVENLTTTLLRTRLSAFKL